MKKILVLTLVLALLVGCGGTAAPAAAPVTKTGLGAYTDIHSSKSVNLEDETDGLAQADVTMAAITLGEDGKIISLYIDVVQPKIRFDAEGNLVTDIDATFLTKQSLGEDYGMRGASPIGKEWFEQAQAIEEWAVGKTVAEVLGMKTKVLNESHPNAIDEPDLVASASMDVGSILKAIELAAANAK